MISVEEILRISETVFPEIVSIREDLHRHPELSFQEFETMEYISQCLNSWGIKHNKGIGGTGIVGEIKGNLKSDRFIALRADIDALPIQEQSKKDYCSINEGVMHACGHDVHTACLLGALRILSLSGNNFSGTVRFIFQPGEEKLPGGATLMIKEGVLQDPVPDHILGQHVFPELESGKVGFRSGMYMASTDELYLEVKGKGGHAALPSQYNNPLLIASKVLQELNSEFMEETTRKVPEGIPTVLAFGKIKGDGATNVIPSSVFLEGTFRTMNEEWRSAAHDRMKATIERIASEMGGEAVFRIEKGYPFLINDEKVTQSMKEAAETLLGKENVVDLDLRMTAEDFAWYSQLVPACFFRLGTRNESQGMIHSVHTPSFDVDHRSILTGIRMMTWLAVQ